MARDKSAAQVPASNFALACLDEALAAVRDREWAASAATWRRYPGAVEPPVELPVAQPDSGVPENAMASKAAELQELPRQSGQQHGPKVELPLREPVEVGAA